MILKNSLVLAFFSILSVLLGIVRDRLLATHIGIGETLDIYNAAFRLPDLLYGLSLAFVTAGTVVPFLTVEDKQGNMVDSRYKLSSLSLFFGGVASLMAVVIVVTLPLYAHMVVPGFTDEQLVVFIDVTRILMIQPILLGITSIISCFAQMKNHFVLYGIAPLGYSFGIIFGIIKLYPIYGVHGLIYGVILGAIISLIIQLFSLRHGNFLKVLPYFSWTDVKELFHVAIPRTGVNVLSQFRVMFFTAFATTLGPGVLSSFLFAQRVSDAIAQVIQQSVTTASLPVLSREFIEHRTVEYKHTVKTYVLMLGALGVIVGGLVLYCRDIVVFLLYGNTGAASLISFFIVGYMVALPLQMMMGYFSISLYSTKDTKSVFYANAISSALSVLVFYFTKESGNSSLIYGVLSYTSINVSILFYMYKRKRL